MSSDTTRWQYGNGYITKNERGTFSVFVSLGHGKRRRTTTKTLAEAKAWILSGNEYSTPDRLLIEDALRARQLLPSDISLEESARFYRQEHKDFVGSMKLSEAWDKYAAEVQSMLRPKSFKSYEQAKDVLLVAVGDIPVDLVTADSVEEALKGKSAHMRNLILRSLSPFLEYCVSHGVSRANVTKSVRRAKVPAKMPTVLAVPEVKRLLKTAAQTRPKTVAYFALGLFAGLRPDEAIRIRPDHIRNGYVVLDGTITKTSDARTVAIRPNLQTWLDAFPVPSKGFSERQIKAVRSAFGAWSQDVCRHCFASYEYELTGNANATAAQMGHIRNTDTMFRYYRALVEPGSGKQFFALTTSILHAR